MLAVTVLLAFLFISANVGGLVRQKNRVLNVPKSLKSDVKQMLYMAGYHQGRTHEKLDRLLENDKNADAHRRLLSRLKALEKLVKEYRKENDRRFLENKDDGKTIAFTVSSSALSNYNNQKIIYKKIITNKGKGYIKNTGIFTAPVQGTYVFTWSMMSASASQACLAYIYHNGNRLMMTHSYETNKGSYEVASNTIVLSLKVNDHVWIGTTTGTYCYGYPYTGFSGWKL